jgi:hypothetical protein
MDQLPAFLKRHGFVIAGVALPVVVLVAFALARMAARYTVADPIYDVVYSIGGDYSQTQSDRVCDLAVVDGRLLARWSAAEPANYSKRPRAFRLHAPSGEWVELDVPEPDELAAGGHVELEVEGLGDVQLDASVRAPDGWEFDSSYSSGGPFGEFFGGGSGRAQSSIQHNGRRIEVPYPGQDPYYTGVSFLGWAIPVEESR